MLGSVLIILLITVIKTGAQNDRPIGFSCNNRPAGYYADIERGCQIYHMCDGLGRQFSYACPNATLFQQRMLVCDHWYMVNCNKSEVDYDANLLIGQRDKPFVEDSDTHPFHRTPRPNLLSQKAPDYGNILRGGKSTLNLVGIENDAANDSIEINKRYSLPTHWFTKLESEGASSTTEATSKLNQKVKKQQQKDSAQKKSVLKTPKQPTLVSCNKTQSTDKNEQEVKNVVQEKLSNVTTGTHIQSTKAPSYNKKNVDNDWKSLKKIFLIPDYEFPLDIAERPGYDSRRTSFDTSLK
ncbi:hypothetical protein RI129_001529 [Pyrocoelia pectoralis]|uniref:Chitin-binding type-2 domain-containing protein n=1 Tax=Pyrocoelia pectoralis TaxID=417401 RepID=A0AAN7VJQ7_9COLE